MRDRLTKQSVALVLAVAMGLPLAGSTSEVEEEPLEQALKLTPDPKAGVDVYEVCTACHKPEGWGSADGAFPQLAGQHRTVLIKQLADIRSKRRENPTMYPFTLPHALGGPQDVANLAEYIAQLPMSADNGKGPGTDLETGEKVYAERCGACHGAKGEGNAEAIFPRLQGQHYEYLLRQFKEFRDGKRPYANPAMVAAAQGFSDKDTMAVVDYVSRLSPPAEKLAPPGWENPDYQ